MWGALVGGVVSLAAVVSLVLIARRLGAFEAEVRHEEDEKEVAEDLVKRLEIATPTRRARLAAARARLKRMREQSKV